MKGNYESRSAFGKRKAMKDERRKKRKDEGGEKSEKVQIK